MIEEVNKLFSGSNTFFPALAMTHVCYLCRWLKFENSQKLQEIRYHSKFFS